MDVSVSDKFVGALMGELTYCGTWSDSVSTLAADEHVKYHVPRDSIERTAYIPR